MLKVGIRSKRALGMPVGLGGPVVGLMLARPYGLRPQMGRHV